MLEAQPIIAADAVTQPRIVFGRHYATWSASELDTLRSIARSVCDRATLQKLFPDRTPKAVKKQLSKVREEMGCARNNYQSAKTVGGPAMLDPDDEGFEDGENASWRRRCERANRTFLAAMSRAGLAYA